MSLKDPDVVHPNRRKRIAMVIANPADATATGWPAGFWWSELAPSAGRLLAGAGVLRGPVPQPGRRGAATRRRTR